MGTNTLVHTEADHSIMKGCMKDENTMITCCSDGTRPVIFKTERIDY